MCGKTSADGAQERRVIGDEGYRFWYGSDGYGVLEVSDADFGREENI